jgi:hypothetical protein
VTLFDFGPSSSLAISFFHFFSTQRGTPILLCEDWCRFLFLTKELVMFSPIRVFLSGSSSANTAVLEQLTGAYEFTLIRIPTIGESIVAGVRPELWHSAVAALMACHPGHIVFTGGARHDREWLAAQGASMLYVSDDLVLELISDITKSSTHFTEASDKGLNAKLATALRWLAKFADRQLAAKKLASDFRTGTWG